MFRSYRYRIYPTSQQATLIEKHIGCARFIYNLALETKTLAYSGTKTRLGEFDLIKQLPELKKDLPWLKDVNAQTLCGAVSNLDAAFKNFFSGASRFPKFKSKNRGKQSFRASQGTKILNGKLYLYKFKEGINIVLHRTFVGKIKTATISKTPTGKYFASILVDAQTTTPAKAPISNAVGIDLGIKSFAVTSDGLQIDNPRHLKKSLAKIKFLQRQVSKKVKGSKSRKKAVLKLARAHERVSNRRNDFLHKLSSKLIRENQTICVEDLNSSGIVKNHKLAQAVSDVSWFSFVKMLEYKSEWYGKNLLKIGQFEPSSKICSDCGAKNETLTLSHREWVCAVCGTLHDRDFNAAKNIRNFALKNLSTGSTRKNLMELPTLVGAEKSETDLS